MISGKSNIIHCKDVLNGLIMLLCQISESEDHTEIVAVASLCISDMSTVILSSHRLSFLDELCKAKGVVG